jgi:integrase
MGAKPKKANGDGSIFQITTSTGKTRWKVQVTVGRSTNGRILRTTRTASTRTEATKLLRELLKQRDDGRLSQITNETVATFGYNWAHNVKPLSVRPTTASDYEYLLTHYVFPRIGSIRICDLRAQHVQPLFNVLRAEGKSASTVNHVRSALHGMCTYAVKQGVIAFNPISATDRVRRQPGEKTQVKTPWTVEETVMALRKSETVDRVDCFLHLMLFTGLRPGEALGLRWEDVDLDRNILSVTGTMRDERRTLPSGEGVVRMVRNDPKTTHSRRVLSLQPDLRSALLRQRERQIFLSITNEKWTDSGYVICSQIGTPVNASNNRKYFYKFLKDSGIRKIRAHDLRHVVARSALQADGRIEDISQALGHTRIDTTKQIYAGVVQRLNDRFSESIGDLFSTGVKEIKMQEAIDNDKPNM